jgi:hypothetical protein
MSCPRGDAAPDQHTKFRLFAASGGYCQNPGCERQLFVDTGSKIVHIAEWLMSSRQTMRVVAPTPNFLEPNGAPSRTLSFFAQGATGGNTLRSL